jgi:mono/diheme cytochrome c family protein
MNSRLGSKIIQSFSAVAFVVIAIAVTTNCAGPQPLRQAIRPQDEDSYVRHLNAVNGNPATAYANWMASERETTAASILNGDEAPSATRNPFDAHRDPIAVSRGAVIYKLHCARCHADDARGVGPSILPDHPATNFKSFGKRFAATLHRGAPRKWFRVIREGSGDVVEYPDERTTAMPAFGDKLTREQVWLVITYLQSLDMHIDKSGEGGHEGTSQ